MVRTSAWALGLLLSVTSAAPAAPGSQPSKVPTAKVKNGTYVGVHSKEYDQDFFLGVPYAQPPVGSLRFRNPVGLNSTWKSTKEATQYSPEVCSSFVPVWVQHTDVR